MMYKMTAYNFDDRMMPDPDYSELIDPIYLQDIVYDYCDKVGILEALNAQYRGYEALVGPIVVFVTPDHVADINLNENIDLYPCFFDVSLINGDFDVSIEKSKYMPQKRKLEARAYLNNSKFGIF